MFYVTDLTEQKITSASGQQAVRRQLRQVFDRTAAEMKAEETKAETRRERAPSVDARPDGRGTSFAGSRIDDRQLLAVWASGPVALMSSATRVSVP